MVDGGLRMGLTRELEKLFFLIYMRNLVGRGLSFLINKKTSFEMYTTKSNFRGLLSFLKLNGFCQFKVLLDLVVIDYVASEKRFKLVYALLSPRGGRVTVCFASNELDFCTSIVDFYHSAG